VRIETSATIVLLDVKKIIKIVGWEMVSFCVCVCVCMSENPIMFVTDDELLRIESFVLVSKVCFFSRIS
jgi:hypothetical protein